MAAPALRSHLAVTGEVRDILALAEADPSPLADPAISVAIARPDASGGADLSGRLRARLDEHDVALILADDAALASACGCEGVEIAWSLPAMAAARALLRKDASLGARVGLSRHDAMEAAEGGADYVRFQAPGPGSDDIEAMIEMALWWAEIFQVPCVASGAETPDAVARLAAGSVEFIAIGAAALAADGRELVAALAGAGD